MERGAPRLLLASVVSFSRRGSSGEAKSHRGHHAPTRRLRVATALRRPAGSAAPLTDTAFSSVGANAQIGPGAPPTASPPDPDAPSIVMHRSSGSSGAERGARSPPTPGQPPAPRGFPASGCRDELDVDITSCGFGPDEMDVGRAELVRATFEKAWSAAPIRAWACPLGPAQPGGRRPGHRRWSPSRYAARQAARMMVSVHGRRSTRSPGPTGQRGHEVGEITDLRRYPAPCRSAQLASCQSAGSAGSNGDSDEHADSQRQLGDPVRNFVADAESRLPIGLHRASGVTPRRS
jgi:hypothetical protein